MRDISVIIVNWNTREYLRRALESIYTQEDRPKVEFDVWVVDNASHDGSSDMVEQEFGQARLVKSDCNMGYVRANNVAIGDSQSRYVFLLNSDAYLESPAALDELVIFGDTHPTVGIAGAKVFNPDGSLQLSCRRFPTFGAGMFRNTLLGKLFPNNKFSRTYLMGDVDHKIAQKVDWVSGCAMLIRRDLIDNIGPYDERFTMYCEDVDICKRTWDAGSEVWYCPNAHVFHRIGASSDQRAEDMIWQFHRSWEIYWRTHNPKSSALAFLLVRTGLRLRAYVRVQNRRRAVALRRAAGHPLPYD